MAVNQAKLKWVMGGVVCALTLLACTISGQLPDQSSEMQLKETELALQATQLAIQAGQLAATQTALAMPVPVAEPTATLAVITPQVEENNLQIQNANGTYFEYPDWLASGVKASIYDAPPANPDEPYFIIEPDHRVFEFNNYVLADHFLTPQILIFPLNEYWQINEGAASQIGQLEDLLMVQGIGAARPASMPFLPIFNAAQSFYTKVEFITTEQLSGVRYLTQFQQAVYPIQNGNMIYTFQGITSDRQYYIAAIFPESHDLLDAYDQFEYTNEFEENFMTYLTQTADQLQAQPDDGFQPGLDALDAVIRSIRVE